MPNKIVTIETPEGPGLSALCDVYSGIPSVDTLLATSFRMSGDSLSRTDLYGVYVEFNSTAATSNGNTYTNCVFSQHILYSHHFNGDSFTGCTIPLVGRNNDHPIFTNCSFHECTFLVYTEDSGLKRSPKNVLMQNCTFGASEFNWREVFTDYNDPAVLPEGAFWGWKRLNVLDSDGFIYAGVLAKLYIGTSVERVRGHLNDERKVRVECARVEQFYLRPSSVPLGEDELEVYVVPKGYRVVSVHDRDFEYRVGQTVLPDSFNPNPRVTCTNGIHLFVSLVDAYNY